MGNVIKMKSAETIDRAYRDGASRAPARYKEGIAGVSNEDWKAAAKEGQDRYVAQVTSADVQARRLKGIDRTNDWKSMAEKKGAERIGSGMTAGAEKRKANYEPIRSGLNGLALPTRTTDPYANLVNRGGAVIKAQRIAAGKE